MFIEIIFIKGKKKTFIFFLVLFFTWRLTSLLISFIHFITILDFILFSVDVLLFKRILFFKISEAAFSVDHYFNVNDIIVLFTFKSFFCYTLILYKYVIKYVKECKIE